MDREQEEIQFLGLFGILKESYDMVSSWRKTFTQITLFLILPLSSVYLAHIQISEILFRKIMHNEYVLEWTPEGSRIHDKVSDMLRSEWTAFVLFKIGYLVFFIVLALLSTAAVVYTVACIYTAKEEVVTSFNKVLSVVPKVWKRLMLTFVWNFIIVFAYNLVSLLLLFLGAITVANVRLLGPAFLTLFFIAYLVGFLYITMIWHLASVVSVLEESYGLGAMRKSRSLIRGKMGVSAAVFFVLGLAFFGTQHMFKILVVVVAGGQRGSSSRIGYGIVCLLLLSITLLLGLLAQTVLYFVCKSYHHENIDKSSLADHLGGYLGEYVPLKSRDVQLEQFEQVV